MKKTKTMLSKPLKDMKKSALIQIIQGGGRLYFLEEIRFFEKILAYTFSDLIDHIDVC